MTSSAVQSTDILRDVFGYQTFRPLQEDCIRSVLSKQDVLLLMPTGGGKSLCYQIPALLFPGLTVVVSPLISLMNDQVYQLQALGVEADMLNSSLSWEEYQAVTEKVYNGEVKMLLLAPETLMKDDVLQMLAAVRVDCVTIDEAHCISEWGHDFRPQYRRLSGIRGNFPDAVYLAMTATATPRVRKDIVNNLGFSGHQELVAGFNRSNLFYEIEPKVNPLQQTLDFLSKVKHQSGIIYCFSRKQVDALSQELSMHGFKALPYHAGLGDEERHRNQKQFICDDVQIIVATIAFGMGINKPNVRFVIHYDLPRNIESYYQETGRAGRDGLPAHCFLLFGYGDIRKIRYIIDQKSDVQEQTAAEQHLQAMIAYAESRLCRRVPLITYFGEAYTRTQCGQCDNCVRPAPPTVDLTEEAAILLKGIYETHQTFGAVHVINVLMGRKIQKVVQYGHDCSCVFGIGKHLTLRQWQFILRQLLEQGLVYKESEYQVLKLNPLSQDVLEGRRKVEGEAPPIEQKPVKKRAKKTSAIDLSDMPADEDLLMTLKRKRKQLADAKGVPPYVVFPDKTLIEISQRKPSSKADLHGIFGIGAKKLETYGPIFIKVVQAYIRAS